MSDLKYALFGIFALICGVMIQDAHLQAIAIKDSPLFECEYSVSWPVELCFGGINVKVQNHMDFIEDRGNE